MDHPNSVVGLSRAFHIFAFVWIQLILWHTCIGCEHVILCSIYTCVDYDHALRCSIHTCVGYNHVLWCGMHTCVGYDHVLWCGMHTCVDYDQVLWCGMHTCVGYDHVLWCSIYTSVGYNHVLWCSMHTCVGYDHVLWYSIVLVFGYDCVLWCNIILVLVMIISIVILQTLLVHLGIISVCTYCYMYRSNSLASRSAKIEYGTIITDRAGTDNLKSTPDTHQVALITDTDIHPTSSKGLNPSSLSHPNGIPNATLAISSDCPRHFLFHEGKQCTQLPNAPRDFIGSDHPLYFYGYSALLFPEEGRIAIICLFSIPMKTNMPSIQCEIQFPDSKGYARGIIGGHFFTLSAFDKNEFGTIHSAVYMCRYLKRFSKGESLGVFCMLV